MIPTHCGLFQLKAQILDGFDWKENAQKLLSLAKLIGTCKYLDTESFSHKLGREVLIEV